MPVVAREQGLDELPLRPARLVGAINAPELPRHGGAGCVSSWLTLMFRQGEFYFKKSAVGLEQPNGQRSVQIIHGTTPASWAWAG